MAYRRSLATRARLFAQQRFAPSYYYANREDDPKIQRTDEKVKVFLQSRSYGCPGNKTNSSLGFGAGGGGMSFRDPRSQFLHAPLTTSGFLLARNMSTTIGDGDGAEAMKTEYMGDMADVVAGKTMEVVATQAAAVSEVAVAAAESWPPVAALQHVIDGIHNFTGLNWWACIVVATVGMKALLAPIMINQLKGTSKLSILGPELEQIQQKMQDKSMSLEAVAELEEQKKRVYMEFSGGMCTQLTRVFIQAPVFVSFYLAIQNMVEKVPSFQTGGVSWFIDLTTADSYYIFPLLTAFSVWITVEFNIKGGKHGAVWKNIARGGAALTLPLTVTIPKALFCYWITSNLFSFLFGLTITKPSVKKFFNIPIIAPPPLSPANQSKPTITNQSVTWSSPPTSEEHKSTTQSASSSSLNHRIKILEKQVKGRKQNKRKKR